MPKLPFFGRRSPSDATPAARRASEKRKHYRVRRPGSGPLGVRAIASNGATFPAECDDVSLGGCALRFPAQKAPKVAAGQDLGLEFQSLGRPKRVHVVAKVLSVATQGGEVRVGLIFPDTGALLGQLDAWLARFFNRRRDLRVLPDLAAKFPVALSWKDGRADLHAHDLSVGGLGLSLPTERVQNLGIGSEVAVSFTVPGRPVTLQLTAKVAHLRDLGKLTFLGMEFDEGPALEAARSALTAYVEARVAQMQRYNSSAERRAS